MAWFPGMFVPEVAEACSEIVPRKKKSVNRKIQVFEKDVNLRFMVELEQLFWGGGNFSIEV